MDKFTYTEALDFDKNLVGVNRSDGAFIPADPGNSDYQAYLEHLTESLPPEA